MTTAPAATAARWPASRNIGYPAGRWGIMVKDCTRETVDKVQVDFLPFPTDLCDLCARRTSAGEKPACVKHCMSACMSYGDLDELAQMIGDNAEERPVFTSLRTVPESAVSHSDMNASPEER